MGIVVSNAYLATFGVGTLFGAVSAYAILRSGGKVPVTPHEERYKVRLGGVCFDFTIGISASSLQI